MTTLSDAVYGASAWEDIKEGDTLFLDIVGKSMSCDELGVWVRDVGHPNLNWHPLNELDDPIRQDPRQNPQLPFPFSARQLAAFMLDGAGYFIRERFGDWEDGPYDEVLNSMPDEALAAKDAIAKAYQAFREAMAMVGPLDPSLAEHANELNLSRQAMLRDARAQLGIDRGLKELAEATDQNSIELREELWRQLDTWKESPGFQSAKADHAKAQREAVAAALAWRKKMVQYLLCHRASHANESGHLAPQTVAEPTSTRESKEDRQNRRYQMCLDAGLKMPANDYAQMPRGIGAVANREGIKRQSFVADVKAHIIRMNGR